MSIIDEVLTNNENYAAQFKQGELPLPPARNLAVVACMDARMVVTEILGIGNGDAHIIRNESRDRFPRFISSPCSKFLLPQLATSLAPLGDYPSPGFLVLLRGRS